MKLNKKLLWLVALVMMLAGCAKPYSADGASGVAEDGSAVYGDGAVYGDNTYMPTQGGNIYGAGNQNYNAQAGLGDFYEDPTYGVNVVGGPSSSGKDRVIYFSYDSAKLDNRSAAVVREHARYLRANPQTRVVLEGHTDERGSREYNVGLGERRAYSVRRIFEQEGVRSGQMRVLSYGEERPAAFCSNESCYAKNRRVVIIY
ncbi:peptidoglycan-associated lipoprotein Pal [Suttonella ornithocola]|uniref:Peptidoglycan-associated lipoprotein n=1 Tax=Suttonella ornithocola TaxID=279832 RepID=A0A380MKT1_9GAMM|nr:peptidoglycan-associated lipoprotein Pal [Suttonella ornithocola]SUO93250.1 Peptidoglycan-associated lipoprotein precursor [Suttonella ornithocola]